MSVKPLGHHNEEKGKAEPDRIKETGRKGRKVMKPLTSKNESME
jgi:hypothetical protein